jgi:hypothetical protein
MGDFPYFSIKSWLNGLLYVPRIRPRGSNY